MTNRTFGVEIEFFGITQRAAEAAVQRAGISAMVERYNHRTPNGYWKLVYDVSVNGSGTGIGSGLEIVSPILSGDEGLAQVDTVLKALREAGAKVDRSCGIHVHHDARDFNGTTWRNLIKSYMKFESIIDQLMPESRRANANQFCMSLLRNPNRYYGPSVTVEDAFRALGSRSGFDSLTSYFQSRYYKINLESYLRHGTVEFRHHAGSLNGTKVTNWIKLTQGMVERSVNRGGVRADGANLDNLFNACSADRATRTYYRRRFRKLNQGVAA